MVQKFTGKTFVKFQVTQSLFFTKPSPSLGYFCKVKKVSGLRKRMLALSSRKVSNLPNFTTLETPLNFDVAHQCTIYSFFLLFFTFCLLVMSLINVGYQILEEQYSCTACWYVCLGMSDIRINWSVSCFLQLLNVRHKYVTKWYFFNVFKMSSLVFLMKVKDCWVKLTSLLNKLSQK